MFEKENTSWLAKSAPIISLVLIAAGLISPLLGIDGFGQLAPYLILGGAILGAADICRHKIINHSGHVNLKGDLNHNGEILFRSPRPRHTGSTVKTSNRNVSSDGAQDSTSTNTYPYMSGLEYQNANGTNGGLATTLPANTPCYFYVDSSSGEIDILKLIN